MLRFVLLALTVALASSQIATVEFTAVVSEAGDTADFKWTEGTDLGEAAAAFCAANVAAEFQDQCVPAIAAQVQHALAEQSLPAVDLEVQVGADGTTAVFKHRDGADVRAEASAFCAEHVPEANVPACARALVEGAVQKAATPPRDPLEPEAARTVWSSLLGPSLVAPGGALSVASLEKKGTVALLFAADWCKPCRDFVPKLKKYYELANRKGADALEIVWISASRSQAAYDSYLAEMPWPAVPLARAPAVIDALKARGFPTLCFLDKRGAVVTCEGVKAVMGDPYGLSFPYRTPAQKAARLARGLAGLFRAVLRKVGRK